MPFIEDVLSQLGFARVVFFTRLVEWILVGANEFEKCEEDCIDNVIWI